ncbi:MAG: ATP-binding cassette domain-containing protein [Cytophagia bacterium]|nr:MAG: ATP-binding cassette domain-containing protein [Runella sp.]TAG16643.1 MAG: ATP-binding cassette domain-containing protein [Cytophagales bacterium]TAG35921.1 MAG: ATP-binding cassette domain-containing protein [Cytophagia bacterium]TAG55911.1 MAG: ATP-binding cassette domain-containing protein [Runella slithyformis]TAG77658.1 MAG: ATP-binding cassette domain-containing protein [Cytophagales bacterium]
MITKVTIRNFKKLENLSFSLSQSLVIVGPNNSGKSTIFQALCLWEIGVINYIVASKKNDLDGRGFVVINRKDLLNSPILDARSLWRDKKVTQYAPETKTKHVKLEIEIQGENDGIKWACLAEFTFTNTESFTCRIVDGFAKIADLYENGKGIRFGFLQPMSGISSVEDKLQQGAIARRLGEGKTAEVLRNICYEVLYPEINRLDTEGNWNKLCIAIQTMFGAALQKPEFIKVNGTIQLEYIENKTRYDISSGGRGFQQTLLLLAYMFASPNTILLLDEPDAHLEVIRQRQAFQLINELASQNNTQIIIASHSEVVLDEAADASKVIALIENQAIELNTASNRESLRNIKKALTEIGWEKYYLAKQKNHVLYVEGSTDLQMLLEFAKKLNHQVEPILRLANVQYTGDNVPNTAVQNFKALEAFFPNLNGLALFDRIEKNVEDIKSLKVACWKRREIENYFATPAILLEYAALLSLKNSHLPVKTLKKMMQDCIELCTLPLYLQDLQHEWWKNAKLSSDWLDLIFSEFYKRLNVPQGFYKRDYYRLISLMASDEIDDEIIEKLDLIYNSIK